MLYSIINPQSFEIGPGPVIEGSLYSSPPLDGSTDSYFSPHEYFKRWLF